MTSEQYRSRVSLVDNKMWRYYRLLNRWMNHVENGVKLEEYFTENQVGEIAIYGAGDMAAHLINELKDSEKVSILYVIESKEPIKNFHGIEVVGIDDIWIRVDAIVVTPIMEFRSIKRTIAKKIKNNDVSVISLEELVFN